MAPKKKSPSKTVVKAKPKTGKKGAASVFPKDKGGRTWSENDRGLPSSGHAARRPPKRPISAAARRGLQKLSKAVFGKAAATPPSKKGAPAPSKPGPPRRKWLFNPDDLEPERPVPVEVDGRLVCSCCATLTGKPVYIVKPQPKRE